MPKPDEHPCRPDFVGLKSRLYEKGCREEFHEIAPGWPKERYIVNPGTGQSVCCEHWVDSEEVSADMCAHVLRSLGFDEDETSVLATDGEEVKVSLPPTAAPRPSN